MKAAGGGRGTCGGPLRGVKHPHEMCVISWLEGLGSRLELKTGQARRYDGDTRRTCGRLEILEALGP